MSWFQLEVVHEIPGRKPGQTKGFDPDAFGGFMDNHFVFCNHQGGKGNRFRLTISLTDLGRQLIRGPVRLKMTALYAKSKRPVGNQHLLNVSPSGLFRNRVVPRYDPNGPESSRSIYLDKPTYVRLEEVSSLPQHNDRAFCIAILAVNDERAEIVYSPPILVLSKHKHQRQRALPVLYS